MSENIRERDLPVVSPGAVSYLRLVQNGQSYNAYMPDVTNAATVFTETLTTIVTDTQEDIAPVIAGLGYLPPVAYTAAISMTSTRQTVEYAGQVYAALDAALPFTTSGTFETAAFRVIQGVVGTDLSSATGAGMVGFQQTGMGAVLRSMLEKARERVSLRDYGAVGDGVTDDSAAITAAFATGKPVYDPIGGTYYCASTVRLTQSFQGARGNTVSTVFKKGPGALVVHYPSYKRYSDYEVNANGQATGVDVYRPGGGATYDGGIKYSVLENITVRNATARAFNLNGPLFGATLINPRVWAQASDGSQNAMAAFYMVIESGEGVSAEVMDSTNAAFTLITPNMYGRQDAPTTQTFMVAKRLRGMSAIGCEVSAARMFDFTQVDGFVHGAFEFINQQSTLFNCSLEIGGGSNLQTIKTDAANWTAFSGIPFSGQGRHIFRVAGSGALSIPNISLFNSLGANSGASAVLGLVGVASGATCSIDVGVVNEYDNGGGGFAPYVQVVNNLRSLAVLTKCNPSTVQRTAGVTLPSGSGAAQSLAGGAGERRFYVPGANPTIRSAIASVHDATTARSINIIVTTFDSAGSQQASKTLVAVPNGSVDGTYVAAADASMKVPSGGYFTLATNSGSAYGSTSRIAVQVDIDC